MEKEQFYYDNKIVKMFLIATIVWGVVGMLVGLLVAFLFIFPNYMEGISWLSFGRLRPLHTNAVIFAFVGNSIFMGIYYSMQRLLKARMFSDVLSKLFIKSVRSGQYDDLYTPSVRMLFDDEFVEKKEDSLNDSESINQPNK